jgi:hypothetical protein
VYYICFTLETVVKIVKLRRYIKLS